MISTTVYEKEIELNGTTYLVDIDVFAEVVDESFTHEFGTYEDWGTEIAGLEVVQVQSEEGVVTSPTIIKQIENRLDIDDFKDVDFN